jgi:serine/threonine protein kinase
MLAKGYSGWRVVSSDLSDGESFGGYHIVRVAGSGGMGIVYRAEQRSLGRTVALKVMRPEVAQGNGYRERFLREARLAGAVDHPHVVSVFDVGEQAGRLYLVMQWVEGVTLRALIDGHELAPTRTVRIGAQLALALGAVHDKGLVHRDVKPTNVLVRDIAGQDHAYLLDFGIAKLPAAVDELSASGLAVGTTGYMSPEQIRGQQADSRSDLYALGCVVFEALTGERPFVGENQMAVQWAHASSPRPVASHVRADIGSRYDAFLERALAIDPGDRFPSGRAFADALEAAHAGKPNSVADTRARADEPTELRAGAPARSAPPLPPLTPDAGEHARRPVGAAAAVIVVSYIVFIISLTLLTDYINDGTGMKSLRFATSGDESSPLYPHDFWALIVLSTLVLTLTIASLRLRRRQFMAGAVAVSLGLIGYTVSIPYKGLHPGFSHYGSSYWLSLAAGVAMTLAATVSLLTSALVGFL